MVPTALKFPRVAFHHRDLLRSFVWRDLASRYEGSMLGRFLPVVYPALLLALYHLVFAEFLDMKYGEENSLVGGGWASTFYLLSGVLPWLAFADIMVRSTNVILENSNLIKKIAFPSELLPAFVALAHMVHMLISLGLFIGMYLVVSLCGVTDATFSDGLKMSANMLYLPIPILLQLVFCMGVGMILATANVFVRDLGQVVAVFVLLWMLVSPIFYPVSLVAKNAAAKDQMWMLTVMQWNPVYHMLVMYRACFPSSLDPSAPGGPGFPWGSCGIFAVIAFGVFVLGHWFFVACKGLFPDEV